MAAKAKGASSAIECPPGDEADWLRLIRSENVGAATFWSLLDRYGSAGAALDALPGLAERGGSRRPLKIAPPDAAVREAEAGRRLGVTQVYYGGPDYPPLLASIYAPPPVIAVRGDVRSLSRRSVAVVGSRKASAAGLTMARRLAGALSDAGYVVVSGLALGIDAAAHDAALEGGTVAVVAGGVDCPTPQDNAELADAIAFRGALVSERPLGFSPFARDYPRRNRLIAGLSEAVVVVEAAEHSGTLHTARYAADANREVFAVPGSPLDPRAAGCLALLRDGAAMAVEARDIIDALSGGVAAISGGFAEDGEAMTLPREPSPADAVERVASALSITPLEVDDLVRASALPAGAVLAALMELELAGRAEREADGRVRAALRAS